MNKLLTHIPGFLKNKYLISFAAFCVIILFVDKNNLFNQLDKRKELKENLQSIKYYSAGLATERQQLQALENNPVAVEKVAREKHLMKRDNEELFIISEKPDIPKN
jgi:cell division protein FtsB